MANTYYKVRLTFDLSLSETYTLKDLASLQRVTVTEALRRAIATDSALQARRKDGSKILLEKNGKLSELIFTR